MNWERWPLPITLRFLDLGLVFKDVWNLNIPVHAKPQKTWEDGLNITYIVTLRPGCIAGHSVFEDSSLQKTNTTKHEKIIKF